MQITFLGASVYIKSAGEPFVFFGGGGWLGIVRLSVPIQKEKISHPGKPGFEMTGKSHALSRSHPD